MTYGLTFIRKGWTGILDDIIASLQEIESTQEAALRASYQDGERVEREEIVAWLRMRAKAASKSGRAFEKEIANRFADQIESGEHK
jgi:hypothetical protein